MVTGFCDKFRNHQGLFAWICSAALRNKSGSSTEDPLQCTHFCLRYNRHLERFAGDVLHGKFTHLRRGILELNLEVIALAEHGGFCVVYILHLSFII